MAMGSAIGYVNFSVMLLVLTGFFMLRVDVKGYKELRMRREQKAARYLGWFNVVLGIAAFLTNWFIQLWM